MAASVENIKYILGLMTFQTIGPNKVNGRYSRFLKDHANTTHMKKHAAIMTPSSISSARRWKRSILEIASWHRPLGGYFVSINLMHGTAKWFRSAKRSASRSPARVPLSRRR